MALSQKHRKPENIPKRRELERLLAWYRSNDRDVPWRYSGNGSPDPYKIWLSEIMCQQTTVKAVIPYYEKFLKLWPDIKALAAAPETEVLANWAGLGYYSRARNLHKCAQIIITEHQGSFPANQKALQKLPGIGEYTSAAIAAFCFHQPSVVVDGNVERVLSRYHALEKPLKELGPQVRALAGQWYGLLPGHGGDLAQALMDLGAMICIPKTPRCDGCPLGKSCAAKARGQTSILPVKSVRKSRVTKRGFVYWIMNGEHDVLFHTRPSKGLLAGMTGLPTSSWLPKPSAMEHLEMIKPLRLNTSDHQDTAIKHSFTHFDLELVPIMLRQRPKTEDHSYFWEDPDKMKSHMPTVFRKALEHFQSHTHEC